MNMHSDSKLSLPVRLQHRYPGILFFLILAGTSIIKIWLDASLRVMAEPLQKYDDALYAKLAYFIINGNWLGNYDQLTLAKYPLYPMWLALNHRLGLPLLLSQSVLYTLAVMFLVYQLYRTGAGKIVLAITALLLLFNPFVEIRVMREGIYSTLIIAVIGCFIALHRYLLRNSACLALYSCLAGIFFSFFWFTREEGVWFLPCVFILTIFYGSILYQEYKFSREFFLKLLLLCTPCLMLLVSYHVLCLMNYHHYGVYRVCDQNSKPYTSAMGSLLRVRHTEEQLHLLVPQVTRDQVYGVSPAFRELKPYLDGYSGNAAQREAWKRDTCAFYPNTCSDYGGAWFYWAFRLAVSEAGHYSSAIAADRYYHRLEKEIDQACSDKMLDCAAHRDTIIPPYRKGYTSLVARTCLTGIRYILEVPVRDYVNNPDAVSIGNQIGLQFFSSVTRSKVLPLQSSIGNGSFGKYDLVKMKLLAHIGIIYQSVFKYIILLSMLGYLVLIAFYYKCTDIRFIVVMSSSILACIMLRLVMLSYIDLTLFPAYDLWPSYINPFYPLFLVFVMLISVGLSKLYGRHLTTRP